MRSSNWLTAARAAARACDETAELCRLGGTLPFDEGALSGETPPVAA